ncbi:molybdenum cofactor biosynthesis protein [Nannochloropsis gaditana]|uniref:Molybdenum cofactor biosynthesis protein n=1 Tax=Nannochloropsis gaditana TaxID=72520 RepID=W7TR83_9STRA|nr:molybdenum cofactor biosynthesis protein [Nannochloropsis gaditana]
MPAVDAIFTSGGTSFAPRDLTPEAVRPLIDKEAPGMVWRIMEVGTKHTPFAVLSRPVAGVRGGTFIVTLPGSPKAVKENLDTLLPLLPKVFGLLKTATCDHKA